MLEAILHLARTGTMWRDLPARFPPWPAVWQQMARWEARGDWAKDMSLLRVEVRILRGHPVNTPLLMVDAQTARGGRFGPTFHERGGRARVCGAKRTIVADDLGLVVDARVDSARLHDLTAARLLLPAVLARHHGVKKLVADRGCRGLDQKIALGAVSLEIMVTHRHRPSSAHCSRA